MCLSLYPQLNGGETDTKLTQVISPPGWWGGISKGGHHFLCFYYYNVCSDHALIWRSQTNIKVTWTGKEWWQEGWRCCHTRAGAVWLKAAAGTAGLGVSPLSWGSEQLLITQAAGPWKWLLPPLPSWGFRALRPVPSDAQMGECATRPTSGSC